MRVSAQALLPLFLAVFAFVLIGVLWQGSGGADFANATGLRAAGLRGNAGRPEEISGEPADSAHSTLLRGRLVDAQTGEPVAALVTVLCGQFAERQAQAGADGIFQLACPTPVRATIAVPRTEGHFGLVRELDVGPTMTSLALKLQPRRDLPVVLRTPDGRPLAEVSPPRAAWSRETWPTILITQTAPTGRTVEGAPDPLLATRIGRFLSSVHGDVALRPGSPEACVGYVQLLQAPPVSCSLVIGSRVLQTLVLDGHERSISFTVPLAELEGLHADMELRVLDADTGLPPSSRRGLWLGMLGGPAAELDAELDEDGRVQIHDAPAGALELYLRLGGYEYAVQRVDLHAGERNDVGVLRVHAGASIAGHVTTDKGEPVRTRVWCSTGDDTQQEADWFAIRGLPRTSVLVGIDDPRWARNPTEVDLSRGSMQNENLVARPGSILRLVGPYLAAGAARLCVIDAHGRCVWRGDSLELEVHELRFLPGHYTVEVQRPGRPDSRQELELGENSDATILLR
jgi:hypothetical protein